MKEKFSKYLPLFSNKLSMGQPSIGNTTPFQCETLFLTDEGGFQILIPIIKASFSFGKSKLVSTAEEQVSLNLEGEYWDKPENSSYKYEPETAFVKPYTDVVLIGHAHPAKTDDTEVHVGFRVGSVSKIVKVTGDRYWVKGAGTISMTKPKPFEKIPLMYENAFGGWDRTHKNPDKHTFEPRNPVGTGFRSRLASFEEGIRLPNLEDPQHPIKTMWDTPPPAGFGFTSPNWQPRASFAGTYDEQWMKDRMPLLPTDFDRRFFNAASPGLVAPGYLIGNEPVVIENASPRGRLEFNLPGISSPMCHVELRGNQHHELQTNLDTVIVNTDEDLVFLIWRTHIVLRNGPHDVVAIKVEAADVSALV